MLQEFIMKGKIRVAHLYYFFSVVLYPHSTLRMAKLALYSDKWSVLPPVLGFCHSEAGFNMKTFDYEIDGDNID